MIDKATDLVKKASIEKKNMKHLKISLLFLIVVSFSACEAQKQIRTTSCISGGEYDYLNNYSPGTICHAETCELYLAIWKSLFMEQNNLPDSYFDNHIELVHSQIANWNDGVSFNVCYKVKVGWAIAYSCDQFMIKINQDNKFYPALNLPRGTYLSKDQVKMIVSNKAFFSDIIKLSDVDNLKFTSMSDALTYLVTKAKVNTLCSGMVTINNITGNLELEAWAQYDNEDNSCIQGRIDLMTGETVVEDGPCWIN